MSSAHATSLRLLRMLALPALLSAAALALPAPARAEFTRASLLSGTAQLQFEAAEAPALAADGGYVAFQGSLAGVSGVWRRDLQTGAVESVAVAYDAGDPQLGAPEEALGAADATAPSISANGRYVAFTTTADLVPAHAGAGGALEGEPAADAECPEVYVRDMELPASAPGAYTLASALNESGMGVDFSPCPAGSANAFALAGAQAAPGVALSANGRSVAFTVLSESNLARGSGCLAPTPLAACAPETPPSQVAVRNLETQTTTLVTVAEGSEREGEPVLGGGAYPSAVNEQRATTYDTDIFGTQVTGSTAAISGDGTTVAWLGTNVPEQVPGSGPEIEGSLTGGSSSEDLAGEEAEPLWRRVAAGPAAVTKRLLAGAGLDFYFSRSEPSEVVLGGAFVDTKGESISIAPALSEDGEEVATIANAPRPAALDSLALNGGEQPQSDAYLVHVGAEAAAVPQATALTETPNYDIPLSNGAYGYVDDVAISPNGSRVAFETSRKQLTLPGLAAIGFSATSQVPQTYLANFALGTVQRAEVTYDGAEPSKASTLLSVGNDGTLAFASTATNLFYGDGASGSQVYLCEEVPDDAQPVTEVVGAPPNEALPSIEWRLSATAVAKPEGTVQVTVRTPGAGRIAVKALAQLPSAASRSAAKRHKRVAEPRGKKRRARKAPRKVKSSSARLLTRTVAKGATVAGGNVTSRLLLRAGARYRSKVNGQHGLYAVLHVSFAAAGHGTLSTQIPVTFHRKKARAAKAGDGKSGAES